MLQSDINTSNSRALSTLVYTLSGGEAGSLSQPNLLDPKHVVELKLRGTTKVEMAAELDIGAVIVSGHPNTDFRYILFSDVSDISAVDSLYLLPSPLGPGFTLENFGPLPLSDQNLEFTEDVQARAKTACTVFSTLEIVPTLLMSGSTDLKGDFTVTFSRDPPPRTILHDDTKMLRTVPDQSQFTAEAIDKVKLIVPNSRNNTLTSIPSSFVDTSDTYIETISGDLPLDYNVGTFEHLLTWEHSDNTTVGVPPLTTSAVEANVTWNSDWEVKSDSLILCSLQVMFDWAETDSKGIVNIHTDIHRSDATGAAPQGGFVHIAPQVNAISINPYKGDDPLRTNPYVLLGIRANYEIYEQSGGIQSADVSVFSANIKYNNRRPAITDGTAYVRFGGGYDGPVRINHASSVLIEPANDVAPLFAEGAWMFPASPETSYDSARAMARLAHSSTGLFLVGKQISEYKAAMNDESFVLSKIGHALTDRRVTFSSADHERDLGTSLEGIHNSYPGLSPFRAASFPWGILKKVGKAGLKLLVRELLDGNIGQQLRNFSAGGGYGSYRAMNRASTKSPQYQVCTVQQMKPLVDKAMKVPRPRLDGKTILELDPSKPIWLYGQDGLYSVVISDPEDGEILCERKRVTISKGRVNSCRIGIPSLYGMGKTGLLRMALSNKQGTIVQMFKCVSGTPYRAMMKMPLSKEDSKSAPEGLPLRTMSRDSKHQSYQAPTRGRKMAIEDSGQLQGHSLKRKMVFGHTADVRGSYRAMSSKGDMSALLQGLLNTQAKRKKEAKQEFKSKPPLQANPMSQSPETTDDDEDEMESPLEKTAQQVVAEVGPAVKHTIDEAKMEISDHPGPTDVKYPNAFSMGVAIPDPRTAPLLSKLLKADHSVTAEKAAVARFVALHTTENIASIMTLEASIVAIDKETDSHIVTYENVEGNSMTMTVHVDKGFQDTKTVADKVADIFSTLKTPPYIVSMESKAIFITLGNVVGESVVGDDSYGMALYAAIKAYPEGPVLTGDVRVSEGRVTFGPVLGIPSKVASVLQIGPGEDISSMNPVAPILYCGNPGEMSDTVEALNHQALLNGGKLWAHPVCDPLDLAMWFSTFQTKFFPPIGRKYVENRTRWGKTNLVLDVSQAMVNYAGAMMAREELEAAERPDPLAISIATDAEGKFLSTLITTLTKLQKKDVAAEPDLVADFVGEVLIPTTVATNEGLSDEIRKFPSFMGLKEQKEGEDYIATFEAKRFTENFDDLKVPDQGKGNFFAQLPWPPGVFWTTDDKLWANFSKAATHAKRSLQRGTSEAYTRKQDGKKGKRVRPGSLITNKGVRKLYLPVALGKGYYSTLLFHRRFNKSGVEAIPEVALYVAPTPTQAVQQKKRNNRRSYLTKGAGALGDLL